MLQYPFPLLHTEKEESPEDEETQQPTQAYILPNPENPGYYQCTLCYDFEMKQKFKVEKHIKECLQKQQQKRKRLEEKQIIDTNHLYSLIIQLQKEVVTLRQQVKDMKKQEIQRINIQFWLNNHCNEPLPYYTFHQWRKTAYFNPTDEQLQMVFQSDIKKGIQDCIRQVFETENPSTFPIRAFNKQRFMFYIYDYPLQPQNQENQQEEPTPEWRKMTKEEFHKWLETIQHKFLLKFVEWEQINQEWLENDTNNQERIKYLEKINKEIEMIDPQTIRNWLYDEIKRPLKRIVELEFEDL